MRLPRRLAVGGAPGQGGAAGGAAPPVAGFPPGAAAGAAAAPSADLLASRERLTERFALMQSELGGLFYEMAIRDHVAMDVLIEKAAALQQVDLQLAQIEHLITQGGGRIGGHCNRCGTPYAPGAAYCSQCSAALEVA